MNEAVTLSSSESVALESEIRDFLLEDPNLRLQAQGLNADQSLLSSGLIDSLAVLDIIAFLESRFGIQFEPEDLTGENFDRISSMAALVRLRIGGNSRTS